MKIDRRRPRAFDFGQIKNTVAMGLVKVLDGKSGRMTSEKRGILEEQLDELKERLNLPDDKPGKLHYNTVKKLIQEIIELTGRFWDFTGKPFAIKILAFRDQPGHSHLVRRLSESIGGVETSHYTTIGRETPAHMLLGSREMNMPTNGERYQGLVVTPEHLGLRGTLLDRVCSLKSAIEAAEQRGLKEVSPSHAAQALITAVSATYPLSPFGMFAAMQPTQAMADYGKGILKIENNTTPRSGDHKYNFVFEKTAEDGLIMIRLDQPLLFCLRLPSGKG